MSHYRDTDIVTRLENWPAEPREMHPVLLENAIVEIRRLRASNAELADALALHSRHCSDGITAMSLLDWLAARLVNVYGEPDGADFVLALREKADAERAAMAAVGEDGTAARIRRVLDLNVGLVEALDNVAAACRGSGPWARDHDADTLRTIGKMIEPALARATKESSHG